MGRRRTRSERRQPRRRILSAGVIPVRHTPEGRRYLLLRAYQYWDFPKGKVEPGERPLDGALREVREETGISGLWFRWGYDYFETGPYAHGKVARYYLAETAEQDVVLGINPQLGRPEHHEYRWMTPEEAREHVSPRVAQVLEWAEARLGEAESAE